MEERGVLKNDVTIVQDIYKVSKVSVTGIGLRELIRAHICFISSLSTHLFDPVMDVMSRPVRYPFP